MRLVADLNRVYRHRPTLHRRDREPEGFRWLIADDQAAQVYAFLRQDGEAVVLVVANMTPVPRQGYRIGVPRGGRWRELLNSDASLYGGSDVGNGGSVASEAVASHGEAQSLVLTLPPLGLLLLAPEDAP